MSAHSHDHHDHSHSHSHSHGSGKVLLFALIFTGAFAVVEVVAGLLANSLALLSDAGHMLTDSLSLAVGAVAAWLASRPASRQHSFGLQRAEVLGALINDGESESDHSAILKFVEGLAKVEVKSGG